jgi:hypothetical protein
MFGFLLFFHLLRFVSGLNGRCSDSECVSGEYASFLQVGVDISDVVSRTKSNTWDKLKDKHLYVVGVYHKAGSQVLRNIMRKAFDELGADYSCRECPLGTSVITSVGSDHMVAPNHDKMPNVCSEYPDSPIRWNNCQFPAEDLLADREMAGEKGMRAVRIIRDPFQMVASAYCYHHAGNEMPWPGSLYAPLNIMKLNATEGVPLVAILMRAAITSMVKAHTEADGRDTYTVVYERLTNSSADFDATVGEMFDFLFADLITSEDRERIETLARTEDLNSEHFDGDSNDEHVSDGACKEQATAALQLMPADLYSLYQEYQAVLGYA